jgi:hypothetical protein
MINKVLLILSCLAVLLITAGPSNAGGTKWQTNLVPESDMHPTINGKGKVSLGVSGSGKGTMKASVQGLTDGGGTLVTTDDSWKKNGLLNGDEYMVIVDGNFPALSVPFVFNLPFETKDGKGKGKLDLAALLTLMPAMTHSASQMNGAKVVGPLGALNVVDCANNVAGGGFVVLGNPNPCDQGDLIGIGGVILVPEP